MDLSSEEEIKKALKCNREYMGTGVSDLIEAGPVQMSHTLVLRSSREQGVHSPSPWSRHRANTEKGMGGMGGMGG